MVVKCDHLTFILLMFFFIQIWTRVDPFVLFSLLICPLLIPPPSHFGSTALSGLGVAPATLKHPSLFLQ